MIKVGGLRCALCHGDASGLLEGCAGCGALLHADCRRELGRCPTLGCGELSVQSESPSPVSEARLAPRRGARSPGRALFGLGLSAALGLGGFLCLDAFVRYGPGPGLSSEVRRRLADAGEVRAASRQFKLERHRWPASIEELCDGPRPLLSEAPRDPEGRPYAIAWKGGAAFLACETPTGTLLYTEALLFRSPGPDAEPPPAHAQAAAPAAACGVAPSGALVRQHQLSEAQR